MRSKKMFRAKNLIILFLSLVFISSVTLAQTTTARIYGTVSDTEDIPLPGVTVEATSPKLIGIATSVTDTNGVYRLFNLTPGLYTIVFTLEGFKKVTRSDISISVEQSLKLDVQMEIGTIEVEVVVTGKAPLIDVKSASQGLDMSRDYINKLPKGRNFISLVTIVPGVSDEPMLGGGERGRGISVDGASEGENVYFVDGADTTNIVIGRSGQRVNYDFVDEVQFKSSGYQAEFGGSVGGVINVITRSGSNEFHGEILGYYSGTALEGERREILTRDWDDSSKAVYMAYDDYYGKSDIYRLEGGFGLGGYIIKDRLWFFTSFLPVYYKEKRNIPFHGTDIVKDFTQSSSWYNASAKLSAQILPNLRWGASVVVNTNKYKGDLTTPRGNPEADYDAVGFTYPNISAATSFDATFGNNLILTLRGGYFRTDTTNQLVTATEPRYLFQKEAPGGYVNTTNIGLLDVPDAYQRPLGWSNFPWSTLFSYKKNIRMRQSVRADLNYYLNLGGEHSIKLGGQFIGQGENVDQTADFPHIRFAWDMDLIHTGVNYGRGEYGYYAVRGNEKTGPYGNFYDATSNRWAFYIQDSWTIAEKFTLNFGVRTESEYIPTYSDDPSVDQRPIDFRFGDKIAPRLGFSYDVLGDSSLKIFGSYGIYHDVMKLYIAASSFGGEKIKMAYYALDTYEWDTIGVDGNFPGRELYTPQGGVYNYRWYNDVDPNIQPFTQREIAFGAEKKISEDFSATLRVVNKHLIRGLEDIAIWDADTGWELWYFGNPGDGYSRWVENGGIMDSTYPETPKATREYWGLTLSFEKRFSNNWMGGFSYTLSRLSGNYSGLGSSDEPGRSTSPNFERFFDSWHLPRNKNLEVLDGPLPTDRPHRFKAYGSYAFPFGLTVGGVVNAMSGTPVQEEWAVIYEGYLPYGRGSLGRTPFLWYADVYTEYSLKLGGKYALQFNLNIDNLFNVDTAQRIWQIRTANMIEVTQEELLNNTWDLPADYVPDPRFEKEMWFYPPISVRLGVKFLF